jgi:hypothetical protein
MKFPLVLLMGVAAGAADTRPLLFCSGCSEHASRAGRAEDLPQVFAQVGYSWLGRLVNMEYVGKIIMSSSRGEAACAGLPGLLI